MASIVTHKNGKRCIQFLNAEGCRKTIRLGDCDRKSAESICRHVETMLSAKQTGEPLKPGTAVWLKEVGPKLRERLSAVGLIEAPQRTMLGEFLRTHVLNRPDVKSSTLEVWQQPYRNLVTFFGEEMPLRKITAGDADRFAQWLRTQNLAAATVAKRLSFARTFLHVARKHKLIDENPFAEVKIPTVDVSKRQAFVGRDVIDKLLNVATPTWKTIVALSRFGGLRELRDYLRLDAIKRSNIQRSGRDLNPRYGVAVYGISSAASSAARAPLRAPARKTILAVTPHIDNGSRISADFRKKPLLPESLECG